MHFEKYGVTSTGLAGTFILISQEVGRHFPGLIGEHSVAPPRMLLADARNLPALQSSS